MARSAPVRVAAVMDTWNVSGPGRQIAALAAALAQRGVDLRLFMFQRAGRPPSPFIAYLERAGVGYTVISERGPLDAVALGRLRSALRQWQPDIVQSHHYRPTTFVFLLQLLGRSWSWIGFFHGDTTENLKMRLYNRLHDTLLPRADRIVVLSELHREKFARWAGRVRLVPNAALPLPTEAAPVDLAPCRRPGIPLIGVLARLSHEKGVDILLDAVARRRAAGTPVSLVIAGEGPERARLEIQAETLGIGDLVHFLGFVRDVVALYPQLDALVLPSREGAEGMPNVILEALRADRPIVATAVAAVPELLSDPLAGEKVPPGDPAAMAEAIGRALEIGPTPEASAARGRTAARFSLDRRVELHLELYRELRADRFA